MSGGPKYSQEIAYMSEIITYYFSISEFAPKVGSERILLYINFAYRPNIS